MNDLTISQQYLICAVSEKGKLSGFSTEKQVCFVASGLLELQLAGCAAVDKKTVTVSAPLPESKAHIKPLYDYINQPKPVKLEKLIEDYGYTIADKRLHELMDAVGASLQNMGMAQEVKGILPGSRKGYAPTTQAIGYVVDMIRSELLEDGAVTDEIAALTVLLEKSKTIKTYFSEFERKQIRQKLRALADTETGKMVQKMIDQVECLIAVMAALVVVYS